MNDRKCRCGKVMTLLSSKTRDYPKKFGGKCVSSVWWCEKCHLIESYRDPVKPTKTKK